MLSGILTLLVGTFLASRCQTVLSNTISLSARDPAAYEGGAVRYSALASLSNTITEIRWTINGQTLNDLPHISTESRVLDVDTVTLTIRNLTSDLNGYTVACTVITGTGMNLTCDPPQTIQVQGILGPVGNLTSQYIISDNTVNVFWTPPAAITIPPATRPEIFYCIQISNGTSTESIGCNKSADMNENTNSSIILQDVVCGVNYDITITPFNRLGGESPRTEEFPDAPVISDRVTVPVFNDNSFVYTYAVSGLVCSCSAVIQDAGVEGSLDCDHSTPGLLTITTMNVNPNRKFDVRLFANNSRRFGTKEERLSTFDANLAISSMDSTVEYLVTFVNGSTARGVFVALLFMDRQSVNFSRSLYFIQETSRAEMTNQLMGLSAGTYEVLAYDIESSGEITSENPTDQLSVTVTGSSANTTPLQVISGITCDSTDAGIAVTVMCTFNTTLYSGYRVYIQDTSDVSLRFVESNVSGEMVSINGSLVGGEHLVMVYPIWSSDIPDGRLAPALRDIHYLAASVTTIPSPTSEASTVVSTDSSSPPSTDPATGSPPVVVGPSGGFQDMATIVGVCVAIIVVMIIAAVLIVLVVIILVRWNKKRKIMSLEKGEALVTFSHDGQRSPSADNEIPAYAFAKPPPMKSTNEPVKANGSDAPPPASGAALYSTVDLNKKKKEREAKNGDKDGEITPPPEPANEYASVDSIQKNKKEAQEQAHQEPQYETVQLKHKKPTQEKVEDEHLVQYSTIDHFKKAEPEPKKETPKQESVEKPHVGDKIYVRREDVYQVLGDIATRWKEFALLVGASEDYVDEIDCNNTSDFGCLDHFLVMTVKHRSREEMSVALVKMGLMDKAQTILQLPSAQ